METERDQLLARVKELEARSSKGLVQQQQQHQGAGTEGGRGEAVQYLFGGAHEWGLQADVGKGQLSAVGLTLGILWLQQAGRGATLENVLPDYGKTM